MIYTQREAEGGNKKEKGGDERGKKEKGRKREIVWVARWCGGPELKNLGVLQSSLWGYVPQQSRTRTKCHVLGRNCHILVGITTEKERGRGRRRGRRKRKIGWAARRSQWARLEKFDTFFFGTFWRKYPTSFSQCAYFGV
jgi:hypothetical protein